MQHGPSHVKCGCNVDPPHLHILKVDVMWSNVDVLWSNVDFHISNVNKCRYIVGQHNGDVIFLSYRSYFSKETIRYIELHEPKFFT